MMEVVKGGKDLNVSVTMPAIEVATGSWTCAYCWQTIRTDDMIWRKNTLLKDYKSSGKSSVFVDKRIGEQNEELGEFDKKILRSQREMRPGSWLEPYEIQQIKQRHVINCIKGVFASLAGMWIMIYDVLVLSCKMQLRMVTSFGSGVMLSLVSGMRGPDVISTGVILALVNGGIFKGMAVTVFNTDVKKAVVFAGVPRQRDEATTRQMWWKRWSCATRVSINEIVTLVLILWDSLQKFVEMGLFPTVEDSRNSNFSKTETSAFGLQPSQLDPALKYNTPPEKVAQVEQQDSIELENLPFSSEEDKPCVESSCATIRSTTTRREKAVFQRDTSNNSDEEDPQKPSKKNIKSHSPEPEPRGVKGDTLQTEKEENCEKHPASIEWNHQKDIFTNMMENKNKPVRIRNSTSDVSEDDIDDSECELDEISAAPLYASLSLHTEIASLNLSHNLSDASPSQVLITDKWKELVKSKVVRLQEDVQQVPWPTYSVTSPQAISKDPFRGGTNISERQSYKVLFHCSQARWHPKCTTKPYDCLMSSNTLELLEKMLTLDPDKRISAKDALDAEYFWIDLLPCDPKR
ncbi:nucleolar protein 14 [Tanacetum coccineum]